MSHETEWFGGMRQEGGARQRPTLLPLIVWAVIFGLAIGAALYSAKAAAEGAVTTYSTTDGSGNTVRLTLEPCPDAPGWLTLRRAEMRYEGVDYAACWVALGQTVIVFDSNEDITPVPAQSFQKDEGI